VAKTLEELEKIAHKILETSSEEKLSLRELHIVIGILDFYFVETSISKSIEILAERGT